MNPTSPSIPPSQALYPSLIRPLLGLFVTIAVADFLFYHHAVGVSFGLFAIFLATLIPVLRADFHFTRFRKTALIMLALSAAQTARFLSLSNFLVIMALLFLLSGDHAHRHLRPVWLRFVEAALIPFRWIGALLNILSLKAPASPDKPQRNLKLGHILAVIAPAFLLAVLFSLLLGNGNAVFGTWISTLGEKISDIFSHIHFPAPQRIFFWGLFAAFGLLILCPAKTTRWTAKLLGNWHEFGSSEATLRKQQWIAILATLNLLFLVSNVADVFYLWFSRTLPEGISHSRYVHQGVYALIATSVLSAGLSALLTQHTPTVRNHPLIRSLASLWIAQNLIIISGVYLRLWIYIDAYGYTPKRIFVGLFLLLVIGGFAFIAWGLHRNRNIRWLIGANLILLFSHFFILQFIDVRAIVVAKNKELYQQGEIDYPPKLFLYQVDSHSLPYLIFIHDHPQSPADQKQALLDLADQWNYPANSSPNTPTSQHQTTN